MSPIEDEDLEAGSPPSPPQGLEVTAVEATTATLKWKEPKKDGGAPIKEYAIEYKVWDAEEWSEKEDRIKPKKFLTDTVSDLQKNTKYVFRVRDKYSVLRSVCCENRGSRNFQLGGGEQCKYNVRGFLKLPPRI